MCVKRFVREASLHTAGLATGGMRFLQEKQDRGGTSARFTLGYVLTMIGSENAVAAARPAGHFEGGAVRPHALALLVRLALPAVMAHCGALLMPLCRVVAIAARPLGGLARRPMWRSASVRVGQAVFVYSPAHPSGRGARTTWPRGRRRLLPELIVGGGIGRPASQDGQGTRRPGFRPMPVGRAWRRASRSNDPAPRTNGKVSAAR